MWCADKGVALTRDEDGFAAHFSFGMALAAAAVYAKWRGTWGFSPGVLYCFLGIAALLLFGAIVLGLCRWSGSSYAIRLLGILVFVSGLGWLGGHFPAISQLRWILAGAGWMALLIVAIWTCHTAWRMWFVSLVFMGIGIGFGCWTTLRCYGNEGYLSPLSLELFERGMLPHVDTLFLTSISNMIRFYGIPSTGLQGTPYAPYHSCILAIYAWLSNLLNTETITTFVLMTPLLVISLSYGAMLRCAMLLQRLFGDSQVFSCFVAALLIGACTIGLFSGSTDAAVASWHSDLASVTYSFSLFLLFSMMEISLCWMWGHVRSSNTDYPFLKSVGLGLGSFILAAATTFSKGSVGFLYVCCFGFLLLRSGMWKFLPLSLMAGGAGLGCAAVLGLFEGGRIPWSFRLANFFFSYVKTEWLTHLLLCFLWPICACFVLSCLAGRRKDQATSLNAITEVILFLVVLSLMPGLLLAIPGGSADYFANVSVFVGLAALAAFAPFMLDTMPSGREWLRPLPAKWILTVFLIWGLGVGVCINVLSLYRGSAAERRSELGFLAKSKGITSTMGLLAKLRDMSFPDRSLVLVDIPLTHDAYWKVAVCNVVPFVMPSFAGFAFLDGRPDVHCQVQIRGYHVYHVRDIAKEDANLPLCSKRPDKKFRYIVSLAGQEWTVVDCQASGR